MLRDSSTRIDLFFPGMLPSWGLAELGRMRVLYINNDAAEYFKSLQGLYVDGVRKSTVKGKNSVIGTVGGRTETCANICSELEEAFLRSGEPQSCEHRGFLIEYKAAVNDEEE